MIGTIRKHSTWLWLIIIAAIIITFVYWGTPNQGSDRGGGGADYFGSIAGKPISREALLDAQREVYLRYFLNSGGNWPDSAEARRQGFDVERETYYRLMLVQKMEDLDIHVSTESVAQAANNILRSLNRGNPLPLNVFVSQILGPRGMGAVDFERFVRNEIGLQQIFNLTSASGRMVTPQEAREIYARENEERTVQAAFFTFSNHLEQVTVTPENVATFFTNQMARYRLPERLQVHYVKFPLSNYVAEAERDLAAVTNLAQRIDETYEQLGTNFFSDAKSPEEIKTRIRELMFKDKLLANARRAANEFATALFTNEPALPENLPTLAKALGLTAEVSEPFAAEEPPAALNVDASFAQAAFKLSAAEPFAGPLVGEDAVYVVSESKRLPSEIPPFAQIEAKVTEDYRYVDAVLRARNVGQAFYATLTNELAAGKTFTAVCTDAGIKPVLPPPVAPSTRSLPEIENYVSLMQFQQSVFSMEVGAVSGFVPTGSGGYVVYVQSKLPLDETRMKAEMPRFMDLLRQNRQNEAFNAWFRREVERTMRDTPLFRQPPPNLGAAPAES